MRAVLLAPIVLALLLAAVYLLTPLDELEHGPPGRGYIDAHANLAGIGAGGSGCYVHPDLADSLKFGFHLRALGVSREALRENGDELVARRLDGVVARSRYVRRAVILALDGVVHDDRVDRAATKLYVPNEFVMDMAERHRHLVYGASVNPERSDWRRRLTQAKRDGAVLVKWLPALMQIDPSDRRYIDYYRTLAKLELPLLVHIGHENAFGDVDNTLGDPRKLSLPLEQGVTVIAAHAATSGEYDGEPSHRRLLAMLPEHRNLYLDISSLTELNKTGYLVEALGVPGAAERMLYGSGWPLQLFHAVSPFFHWPEIKLSTAKTIQNVDNKLDRDVMINKALGVPPAVFERSAKLLAE